MEKMALEMKIRLEESLKREADAKEREKEASERKDDILKRELEAQKAAGEARFQLEQARLLAKGEELEQREKNAKEKEEEAKRLANEAKRATLDAERCELEANVRVSEAQKLKEEALQAADEAREREAQVQNVLEQARFYLDKGIQPEVWPTEKEFQLAKERVQYDPEKLHFAVCGSSGSGKSSLINAFRGLKNDNRQAAPTGVVETTMAITRYPEPRQELPYTRLVWFDCPGAGTLEIPGWQYFNQQGLFIFDIILLVYDSVIISIHLNHDTAD